MDNRQNNIGNERSQGLLQFRKDDFYNYGAIGNDGFHYSLAMHKSARLLLFAKVAENITESQMGGHCIWVDANSNGRYLDQDHAAEVKLIPTDFVRGKYSQAMYYFSICEDVKNKLHASKPGAAEEQKLQELKSEVDLHLIRLVKLLIHDIANIEHMAETTDNKLNLIIRHIVDNNDKFIPELMKDDDDEWLHLKFNSSGYYYPDETGGLQDNDNELYHIAFHKTLKHVIFTRAAGPEFKFKTAAVHHLYISEDDSLGRYKAQTKEGKIIKQFFVPADYVADRYNRFVELYDDLKKLQAAPDVYSKQTIWCGLQDDTIRLINHILRELVGDLKQEIDKSLDLLVDSAVSPFPAHVYRFDGHYDFTVMIIKKKLVGFNRSFLNELYGYSRHNNTFHVIIMDYPENDVFYMDEKIRILTSKYDLDFYAMVIMGWKPKNNEIQQRVEVDYRNGNVAKLPYHDIKRKF